MSWGAFRVLNGAELGVRPCSDTATRLTQARVGEKRWAGTAWTSPSHPTTHGGGISGSEGSDRCDNSAFAHPGPGVGSGSEPLGLDGGLPERSSGSPSVIIPNIPSFVQFG
jgi:hypothetical protein